MIGVFLVHVGLVRIVRDLAKEKLSRFFSSQAGFFYFSAPSKLLHVFVNNAAAIS